MSLAFAVFEEKSRLKPLPDRLAIIPDPRDPRRLALPFGEVRPLVVCGAMADCDDYEAIAAWGETRLSFLRRNPPYRTGVPGGRRLTLLMNRVNPALFSAAFTAWVRQTWPNRPHLIAIDGKTSRRSFDRADERAPLHLVSAFGTTSRLVLGQEATASKGRSSPSTPSPPTPGSLERSTTRTPTISSRSRPTSRPCAPRSKALSPRRTRSTRTSTTARPWPHRTANGERHPRGRVAER